MKKKLSIVLLFVICSILVFVGPWPVDETHYSQTDYAKNTFKRIAALRPETQSGTLLSNAIKINITPPAGVPLGGNAARDPKENTGHIDEVFVRVLSISNGLHTVSIVSPEILLPLPELVQTVVEKTKLQREEIYFSTTHTHSGPGGYANGIVAEQTLGSFSKNYFEKLTDKIANAILNSRQSMQASHIKFSRHAISTNYINSYMHNQLADKSTSHNTLNILEVRNAKNNNRIANLLTLSVHPTILGRTNRKISGDYPSIIMNNLEQDLGGINIFTIGAPGGFTPTTDKIKSSDTNELHKRNYLGERLSNLIYEAMTTPKDSEELEPKRIKSWKTGSTSINSKIIRIDLPSSNYRISDNWRLSPLLVKIVFHNESTYVHTLQIGKLFFMSYPADFSGILAKNIENWGIENDVFPWINSFNGDYIGYIMPTEFEGMDSYIMRDVNFYGPWAGDYFVESSQKIILQLNETQ